MKRTVLKFLPADGLLAPGGHFVPFQERSVRHFLLSNLVERDGRYVWRLNLDAISAHLQDVVGFPAFGSAYHGPTLFLGGASSGYIRYDVLVIGLCRTLFPSFAPPPLLILRLPISDVV